MQRFYFRLRISPTDYLRHYQGTAERVCVRAHDGRNISFPALNLRQFVTAEGIHGEFCLTVDDDHRLVSIERRNT